MAITPPNFKKDAVPTPRGWVHPRTNELLVSRKITKEQIDEYYGRASKPEEVQVLTEAPTNLEEAQHELMDDASDDIDLESKTQIELEEIGREHGVELDRREKKSTLINKLKGLLG